MRASEGQRSRSDGRLAGRRGVIVIGTVAMVAIAVLVAVALPRVLDTAAEPERPDLGPSAGSRPVVSTFPIGVYRGSHPERISAYESWLGASVDYALEFWGRGADWRRIDDPGWVARRWQGQDVKVVYSIAMLPNDDYTLAEGASGAYDDHWRNFAEVMVAAGQGGAVLRIGWEFNGPFSPWAAKGHEREFAQYWRRIVNAIRSVDGADFTFDWCALSGFGASADLELAYPGDDYVDYVGADIYDVSRLHGSAEERWADRRFRPYGLQWQRDFAAAHDKPVTYPEWGISERDRDDLGGGDSPQFIRKMHRWMSEDPPAYAIYFEYDSGVANHRLMTADFPRASRVFRRLFGNE